MKIAVGILVFTFTIAVRGQDAPSFKADINLVTLLATVRNRDERIVNNLTPDHFVLEEDGVRQTIRYFSRDADLPPTIGLLVDTSRSQFGVLGKESQAGYTFLNQVLHEGKDQAFIVHFDTRVETL